MFYYNDVWYNRDYELLDAPFVLNGVTIPVGGYHMGEWRVLAQWRLWEW